MSATNYALLVPRVRILTSDTSTSNPHFGETPTGKRNGTNKTFRLAFPNPVTGSIFMTYGTTIRASTGFVVLDGPSGYLTVDPAPDADGASATQPFYFDYFSQLYLDAEYNSMLDQATAWLGGVAGTDLAEGLYPAQCSYAASVFFTRRAAQEAPKYASSGGGASAAPQTPTEAFLKLARAAVKDAENFRDMYYKRQGQRHAPASGSITYGMSPGTPPW